MKASLRNITTKGKALYLAYDQGLEHGPTDFTDKNVDPNYIIQIAKDGKYNGIVFHKGIAEAYQSEIRKSKVPLILKLNGKTNITDGEPLSEQICTVKQAIKLGAKAIGYTIYIGSEHEAKMIKQFSKIQTKAHEAKLPTILWIYPRGKAIKGKKKKELMAYATRVGFELGSDIVKIKYEGEPKDLEWATKSAQKTKVVVAGGTKKNEKEFLKQLQNIKDTGIIGLAIGRNIWQHKNPLSITTKIKKILKMK
ncbi:MAG: class I fructose-bisphosphate aldolase [Patescibacteria group bacterium]|jgi:class I fructose-bisphosphate aldolase